MKKIALIILTFISIFSFSNYSRIGVSVGYNTKFLSNKENNEKIKGDTFLTSLYYGNEIKRYKLLDKLTITPYLELKLDGGLIQLYKDDNIYESFYVSPKIKTGFILEYNILKDLYFHTGLLTGVGYEHNTFSRMKYKDKTKRYEYGREYSTISENMAGAIIPIDFILGIDYKKFYFEPRISTNILFTKDKTVRPDIGIEFVIGARF